MQERPRLQGGVHPPAGQQQQQGRPSAAAHACANRLGEQLWLTNAAALRLYRPQQVKAARSLPGGWTGGWMDGSAEVSRCKLPLALRHGSSAASRGAGGAPLPPAAAWQPSVVGAGDQAAPKAAHRPGSTHRHRCSGGSSEPSQAVSERVPMSKAYSASCSSTSRTCETKQEDTQGRIWLGEGQGIGQVRSALGGARWMGVSCSSTSRCCQRE